LKCYQRGSCLINTDIKGALNKSSLDPGANMSRVAGCERYDVYRQKRKWVSKGTHEGMK